MPSWQRRQVGYRRPTHDAAVTPDRITRRSPTIPGMVAKVLLAELRGFCAGVEMAIKALTWMVRIFEPPVYCYHEIVHNAAVVEVFQRVGVVFVDSIDEVPTGRPIMLSAHGSAPEVVAGAEERAAVMVDAVCPWSPRSTTRCGGWPARATTSSTSATRDTTRRSGPSPRRRRRSAWSIPVSA